MPDASPLQTHEAWLRAKQDPEDNRPTLALTADPRDGRACLFERDGPDGARILLDGDALVTIGPFDTRHR